MTVASLLQQTLTGRLLQTMALLFVLFGLLLSLTTSIEKDPDVGRDMIEIVTNKVC